MRGTREENTESAQREIKNGAEDPTLPTNREASGTQGKPPEKAAPSSHQPRNGAIRERSRVGKPDGPPRLW